MAVNNTEGKLEPMDGSEQYGRKIGTYGWQ